VTTIFFSVCFHDVSLCFCMDSALCRDGRHRIKFNLMGVGELRTYIRCIASAINRHVDRAFEGVSA
jgi:hypothetical protein